MALRCLCTPTSPSLCVKCRLRPDPCLDTAGDAGGTELELACKAGAELGDKARVVSMPCWELFEEQSDEYKESIFPKDCKAIVSIEAGSTFGWSKYAHKSIGRDDFGASAPAGILYKEFGITTEAMVAAAKSLM